MLMYNVFYVYIIAREFSVLLHDTCLIVMVMENTGPVGKMTDQIAGLERQQDRAKSHRNKVK